MDNGDKGACVPFRCILTSIRMLQSLVRKALDSDTWLPMTHLPRHHKFMMKCLTAGLEKHSNAILKRTVDLQMTVQYQYLQLPKLLGDPHVIKPFFDADVLLYTYMEYENTKSGDGRKKRTKIITKYSQKREV